MEILESLDNLERIFGSEWVKKCAKSRPHCTIDELISFIREKSVSNYTFFFRDKLMLKAIKYVVIPTYKNQIIKIASVGCSTGEEVYSIIADNQDSNIVVHGYDIDESLLEKARKACYDYDSNNEEMFSHDPNAKTYIKEISVKTPLDVLYRIKMRFVARKKSIFRKHDIIKSKLPEKYDLLVLSNVLCHYTDEGRRIIIENAVESVKNKGFVLFESPFVSERTGGRDYTKFMENLQKFRLKKQKVLVPAGDYENFDYTASARLYRKF